MKFMAISLSFILLFSSTLAKSDSTKRLVKLMRLPETIEEMRVSMIKQQLASNPSLKLIRKEYADTMKEVLNWKNLEKPIMKIYEDHYTKAEMEDLIKFYKTPTGKKSIKQLPSISTATMTATQQILTQYQGKLNALNQVYMQKLKAKKK